MAKSHKEEIVIKTKLMEIQRKLEARKAEKEGAVSIETILISGAILVIAAVVVGTLVLHLGDVNENAAGKIDGSAQEAVDNLDGLEVPTVDSGN